MPPSTCTCSEVALAAKTSPLNWYSRALGAATAQYLSEHIVSWDVLAADGKQPAPLTVDSIRQVPEVILDQLLKIVYTWAGKDQAVDSGNSPQG